MFPEQAQVRGGALAGSAQFLRRRFQKCGASRLGESEVVLHAALGHGVVPTSDLSVKVMPRGCCPREKSLSG
jgi:hypothetical protein